MKQSILSLGLAFLAAIYATSSQASVPCVEGDYSLLPSKLAGTAQLNMESIRISVTVPDRSKIARCAVSPLEYGDMISFSFVDGAEAMATISVGHPVGLGRVERKILLKHLSLHPTLLAAERDIYPHFIRVRDGVAKIAYDLYLDRNGHVALTKAYHLQR